MPDPRKLGRLEKVELRDYWTREDSGFTPWLASEQNIELLSQAVGIDLEVQRQEARVGPFCADVLCRDLGSGRPVVIENQLERTDHAHLGRLLTYAAGLDAVAVIWIASQFTEEHRAALDWLNEATHERFACFGIEIELYRIGSSPAAPRFEVVSRPNGWTKQVREAASNGGGAMTETQQLQLDYWRDFAERLEASDCPIGATKPQPANWLAHGIGRSGFQLIAYVNVRDGRIGVSLDMRGERADDHYAALEAERPALDGELGFAVDWKCPPDRNKRNIIVRKAADATERVDWPSMHDWTIARMADFHRVFGSRIRELEPAA